MRIPGPRTAATAVLSGGLLLLPAAAVALGSGLAPANAAVRVVDDTTPPTAPGTLYYCPVPVPTGGPSLGVGVSICWGGATDNVGVVAYDVQILRDGTFTTISTGNSTSRGVLITSGLTEGQEYTFRVLARDAAGNVSPPSNQLTLVAHNIGGPASSPTPPPSDTIPPSRPGELNLRTPYLNGAVGLVWAPSTDNVAVSRYDVYVWKNGAFVRGATAGATSAATEVMAVVSGLTPGRDYLFYVVAVDAAGNVSAPTNLIRARAMVEPPNPSPSPGVDTTPPGTPSGLSAASGISIPGGLFLTWNTVSDDSGGPLRYDLYRATDTGWVYEGENSTPRDIVNGLVGGQSYTFQVVARDAAGNLSQASAPYAAVAQPNSSPTPGATCKVAYDANSWGTGFTVHVTITNTGTSPISGWRLGFTFPLSAQTLTTGWSATWAQSGMAVTATNLDWNRTIAPGASVSIGFNGTHSGTNPAPNAFTLNNGACTIA
ncbi:cellulose binding domain-containing protein [Microbispora sp. NPDC049125]|uniref:cellulose binding domain-containing protein n=1 Tax=Microbispora sp. NPDC049125 TaxID=3154929 RepID=UPI0034666D51